MYPERVMKALQRAKAALNAGDAAGALPDIEKALQKCPKGFDCWLLSGQAKGLLGDHAGAEQCFRKAIAIAPKSLDGWNSLGLSLSARGRFEPAIEAFNKAIACALQPHPDVYHNLASCHLQLGQYRQAATIYEHVVARKDTSDVWALLAMSYQGLERYRDALAAYLLAQSKGAGGYTLHLNLGTCHNVLNDFDAAAAHAQLALDAAPGDAVALYNLGIARKGAGQIAQAIEAFALSTLPAATSARLLTLNFVDPADPAQLRREHEAAMAQLSAGVAPRTFARQRQPGQRLRVGLVSPDLREHPVAFFIEGLLAKLDRSRLELFIYSDARQADAVTGRLRALGDPWRDTFDASDERLAELFEEDGIDLAIDLAGHTNGGRMKAFAARLAPVQAAYLGYGATTGLAAMDYLLTDDILAPDAEAAAHFTERLQSLGPVIATYTPATELPVAPAPMATRGHPTFGSFAQLCKISPSTVELWADALEAVPAARMFVMTKGLHTPAAQERFLAPFAVRGIAAERFTFRQPGPMGEYLEAHGEIDLILDTVPWNGHTTTMHALWMGAPTLSVKGAHHASRFGEMLIKAARLDNYLAQDRTDFGARAAALTAAPDKLAQERAGLRARLQASPLLDHDAIARRFEQACAAMWDAHRS
jgi:protein O-GlcNAc transferase